MDGRHLIYFADPMCSWCYGFGPVMDQVAARYGERLPIQLVMGGLRPGTDRPMTPEARAELLS
ncbi:MAG: DsbA family protein, partial [Phenylobacterium sp.]